MEIAIPVFNAGSYSIKFGIITASKGDIALDIAYRDQTEREYARYEKSWGMPCILWTGIKKDLA